MDPQKGIKIYGSLYLASNDRKAFFTSSDRSRYTLLSCQNVCGALSYLVDNIYIRFGTKLYRQIVGIPMGKNCAPLVADLFLYCYERDFIECLNHDNQADVIRASCLLLGPPGFNSGADPGFLKGGFISIKGGSFSTFYLIFHKFSHEIKIIWSKRGVQANHPNSL